MNKGVKKNSKQNIWEKIPIGWVLDPAFGSQGQLQVVNDTFLTM